MSGGIEISLTRQAVADLRRLRAEVVATHPDGPDAGEWLAREVAERIPTAVEGLRHFPRAGQPGLEPGLFLLRVPGPTRRLRTSVGYLLEGDRVSILGVTWGGRRFGAPRSGGAAP